MCCASAVPVYDAATLTFVFLAAVQQRSLHHVCGYVHDAVAQRGSSSSEPLCCAADQSQHRSCSLLWPAALLVTCTLTHAGALTRSGQEASGSSAKNPTRCPSRGTTHSPTHPASSPPHRARTRVWDPRCRHWRGTTVRMSRALGHATACHAKTRCLSDVWSWVSCHPVPS
jgi:hypothetical protein